MLEIWDRGRMTNMAIIRYPLSGGKGFKEVSLYKDYADRAWVNLQEECFFETILVCCIGVDVLLNTLPDRLLLLSVSKLDDCQKRILDRLEARERTGGEIIKELEVASVLPHRLLVALKDWNADRNKVFHPFQKKTLKKNSVIPSTATKQAAYEFYRKFCHIIDLAGGISPRSAERELKSYVKERNRAREKHFLREPPPQP